jgi:hypothetical protein
MGVSERPAAPKRGSRRGELNSLCYAGIPDDVLAEGEGVRLPPRGQFHGP